MPSVTMPFLQQECNPTHHMQDSIHLQIEIRKSEVSWSLLPAQTSNLHCESSLSSGDILSSSLLVVSSLFIRWTFICHYQEVILAATFCLPRSNRIQQALSMWFRLAWKPFPFLVQSRGPSRSLSERCQCCPSKSSPPVLQTASVTVLSVVGAAGAQWCGVPWRVSGYFKYRCRLQNQCSHHGFRKGLRKKEQFVGANTGCQLNNQINLWKEFSCYESPVLWLKVMLRREYRCAPHMKLHG